MTTGELRAKAEEMMEEARKADSKGMELVYLRKARNYFEESGDWMTAERIDQAIQ